ncbi:MAG: DNA polymerase III subunit delta [Acidobacteriia bacterium]|nr:DNA polymerase III subunit delta [Terriglobia bacterium]
MARIAAAELLARVEKGRAIPAVLLLGDEAFLRDSCRKLLIEKYVPEAARAWALSRFSAARGEGPAALDQAQTMPMLSPQQVVFLEEAEAVEKLGEAKREDFVKALEAYLENPAPFTTLVLEAEVLDQRMKFAKLLAEKALVVAVSLGEKELERRAAAVAQAGALASELGVVLEAGAAEDLAEWVAEDLQLLKTEMEKLATYAGERRRIRREDVAALVVSQKKNTVWQLAEMLAAGKRKTALEFLERLLRDGDEPVALVGAMAWMYRKLIEAQEIKGAVNGWQAARQLGMRPEMAEVALQSARRMSREQLLSGLRALQECDDGLKGGVREPRALLDFLIARLTGQSASAA